MSTARRRVIILAGMALLVGAWWIWRGNDEARIQRLFERIGDVATKLPGEQQVAAFGKARELSGFFTEKAEAADATSGTVVRGRDELTQHVFHAREMQSSAVVVIEVADLTLDGETAAANVVVRVTPPEGETSELDGTKVLVSLAKVDGDWLLSKAFVERP